MNSLKVGFGRVDITPPMGIFVSGYFIPRYADGVLDELYANAMAFDVDGKKALLIVLDNVGIPQDIIFDFIDAISKKTGVDREGIFISCTHTHTGPELGNDPEKSNPLRNEYLEALKRKIVEVSETAIADLKDAKMGYGVGKAPNVAFIRRFRMKDGSIRTNPGVNNPDILHPIGEIDDRVSVVRFDRENAETLVFVNFANHPDVVGGTKISGDWPALTRKTVEKVLDNTKCLVFNGAQGDINHVNVHPTKGDFNGMFMDFDDVSRGYSHALYIARVVTGGVLQAFDKVNYTDVCTLTYKQVKIDLPSQMPKPEELTRARHIVELHESGRDAEIGEAGMMLTTVVAEAERMVRLEFGPESFPMTLSGISLGEVAFIGIPGEPFNQIGREIKDTEGYSLIIPNCCTNGYEGYFPTAEAYIEGGYEARSSSFAAGVAEKIISESKKLLKDLKL